MFWVCERDDNWFRSMLTDRNGDFDAGAILMVVVTIYMCVSSGYDTFVIGRQFDAQAFGTGIAAMLGGFGIYKWGEQRRAPRYEQPRRRVDIPDDD